MKSFQVITDSTCDVESKFRNEYGLEYVKMKFTIDGREYLADLDWNELSSSDYYNLMRDGKRAITGLVSEAEFYEKFEKYLSLGLDVLYISCSSKLSGSINNAKIIAAELADKYPNNKVICFDSLRSNYSQGLMALDACRLSNEGKNVNFVARYLVSNRLRYQTYATVNSLEFLRKAGRVKASKAFLGDLFGVKPIIVADANGDNIAYKKIRGRKQSLEELCQMVCDNIIDTKNATIYIEHADSLEDAKELEGMLKEKINPKCINISSIGPIIGAAIGPDAITINFYGKMVSIQAE